MQESLLLLLLLPFGVAVASWPLARSMGQKFSIIDYPNYRKVHSTPTLKTGGLLILIGYVSGLFLCKAYSHPNSQPLVLSAVSIFVIGILGDKDWLNAKLRLLLQAGICLGFVMATGAVLKDLGIFTLPDFLQILFTVFAIIGVTNAFNIIDGMNGLSSGIGIIAATSLGMFAFLQGDQEIFTYAFLLCGALIGLMVFNLRGKIFMGDSGSYLTGFIVSALSVMLVVKNPEVSPFAPFLIVLIPVFDTLFAIYRRRRLNRDPFKADRRHLHHILRRRYKSNMRAVVVILLIQVVISLMAVIFYRQTAILISLAVLTALFLRRLWFKRIKLGAVIL
jgi:UDP-GlcNAc:undecaprenyl-phosphate GlcNAc-1-phosphate transferase